MAARYVGFDKLKAQLGKRQRAAAEGKPLAHASSRPRGDGDTRITEDDPRWNPRTMGNHRGSKNTRQTRMNGQNRPT